MVVAPNLLEGFESVDYATWRAQVEADLRGAPFEKKLVTHTYEGIDIQPVYGPSDWPSQGAEQPSDDLSGFPGMSPMTRGATPLGATACGWDIRQEHGHPDLTVAHRLILEDLRRGVTSLHLRLDAAARKGFDPDAEDAEGLVGKDGLSVYDLKGLDSLLADVQLDMIQLSFEAGASVTTAAMQLIALAKQRGVELSKFRGAFNADPLAVLARSGTLPAPAQTCIRHGVDLAQYAQENLPGFTTFRVGTGPYHHAGATAAQDLGFSMATALTYLRAMNDAGMPLEQAAKQLLFNYNIGTNFFLAIGKLRAARRLWSMVLESCGVDPQAAPMLMHVRPSKRVLTQRDPYVNMLRNTVCCFASAVGGAQIITTEPFDKALNPADDFSRRIARNTQLILDQESHLGRVIDPAGGSWFIENLTDELCEKGWEVLQQVEYRGGMRQALIDGYISESIDSAFKPRLKNIATRKDPVTGVSEFPNLIEKPVEANEIDLPQLAQNVANEIKQRQERLDAAKLKPLLDSVEAQAINLEPCPGCLTTATLKAVEAGATLGQIAQATYGTFEDAEISPIAPHPYAEPFERLRDASDEYLALNGRRPQVALINLGPVAVHTARATYAKNFFEAGGFETVLSQPMLGDNASMAMAAVDAVHDCGAGIACVCSSDQVYGESAEAVANALKKAGCHSVVLAGHPGANELAFREAGFDRFIFMKCDVLGTLEALLKEEGVLS